jgi:molecular chaperone HtpG
VHDRFTGVEFYEIPSTSGGLDAVGWILDHGYFGTLPKALKVSGLRLRKGNIQIGENDILADAFPETRFNGWCVGEFHVLNPKILPNGRRDNFEHSGDYVNLRAHIAKIATAISRTCRSRSIRRKTLRSATAALQKLEKDAEIINSIPPGFPCRQKQIDNLFQSLRRHEATLSRRLFPAEAETHLLEKTTELRRKIERLSSSSKKNNHLLKKIKPAYRKPYSDVLSALYDVVNSPSVAHEYVQKILDQVKKYKSP